MADYDISNVPRRVVYAASGVGPYAFTFEVLSANDIAVYKGSTLLTLTTDYTVTIASNGTGSVTLVVTAGTSNITIVGAKTIARTTDFTTGGDFFANTLNDELDAQTIYIQQVAETAERGLKAPVTDPTDIAMTLPAKDGRKGKVLAFDSTTGNPVAGPALDAVTTVIAQSNNINTVATNIASVNTVAGNSSNINTVAGVSGSVSTVATSISNVNTVADDLNEAVSEINTVAVDIANVNNVGNNITSVNTVAGISANVTSVAGNASNINTVAGINSAVSNVSSISSAVTGVNSNSTNINTVAGQITPTNNVATLGGISANITTVAGISANVTSVAGNSTNINTVAGSIANVNSVGTNIANVNSVNSNASNINSAVSNATNINTVAGIASNVTTVASNSGNVTTVAGSIASVNTNATNIANINQNAANIVAIQGASANATAAAASATAAAGSATSASASAAAASAVVLGNEPVRHSVRPSLLLDFANTKTLDPRITFTRASTGTFYDGKTVAKAEENLLTYSQELDNAAWSKTNTTVTANTQTAPDGTTTADTLTGDGTSSVKLLVRTLSTSSVGKTVSIYAKAGTNNFIQIWFNGDANPFANFNLSTGVVGSTGTATTASIVDAGNGWYRCICTTTSTTADNVAIALISSATAGRFETNTLSTTVHLWGGQVENRQSVTAYTATTTAPITNYIPALQTAAAGVARFEHNPVTGESLGLEIEEQRTNLLTYSDDFANAVWNKSLLSVASNTVIGIDGTLTGDKLVEDTSTGTHQLQLSFNIVSGTSYTLSCYVKAAGRNFTQLLMLGGFASNITAIFDLTTGAVGTTNGSPTTQAVNVGNGWWRFSMTATATSTATTSIQLRPAFSSSNAFYQGDGFSGIYIWGAQLEAGAFATSYIPTVASQVTRSADSASMTGTNFSSWYRADEGTVYQDFTAIGISSNDRFSAALLSDTGVATANALHLRNFAGTQVCTAYSASALQAALVPGSVTVNTVNKIGFAYKTNDFAASRNGAAVVVDALGLPPVGLTQLSFPSSGCNTIAKFAYYPKRLQNSELQSLTTI